MVIEEETAPEKEEEVSITIEETLLSKEEPEKKKSEEEKIEISHLTIDEKRETVSIITVIETLEESYKNNDFENWKLLLTSSYQEKYDNSEFLKGEGWDAGDLKTFFHLLVATRKKENITALPISRVEFISDKKALVYVILGEEEFPEPQHTFVRINDNWYKGLREEGE